MVTIYYNGTILIMDDKCREVQPVLLPNVFDTIWCAAKRVTKSGLELSWEERISVEGKLAYLLQYGVYIK